MSSQRGVKTGGASTRRLAVTGGTVLVAVGLGVAFTTQGAATRAAAALLVGSGSVALGGGSVGTVRETRLGRRVRSGPPAAQFAGAALLCFAVGIALAFGPPLVGLPAPTYPNPTPLLALATALVGVGGLLLAATVLLVGLRLLG